MMNFSKRWTPGMAGAMMLLGSPAMADDISVLRLGLEQRAQLYHYLDNNLCSCGCGMTISQCLRDDPSCPVSPEMARSAVAQLLAARTDNPHDHRQDSARQSSRRPEIYNYDGGGGYVSDGECSYVSYAGMSFKDCN